MDVGEYFSLHPTTTHSAVAYLDRLHLSGFSRHEWQMLAISCILIAGTYVYFTDLERLIPPILFFSPNLLPTFLIFPLLPDCNSLDVLRVTFTFFMLQ